jgi:phosphatidylglycerol:prolipoprotein diacylglycerol transferase
VGQKRREQIFDLAFYVFMGGILGSRELFIAVNWQDYTQGGKSAEAYAMVLDMVVLAGLILRIAFRERLLSTPAAREAAVQNAFGQFLAVVIGGRVVFSLLPMGRGLTGLADMLGGGLVFYGGLIGASLFAFWYALANGIEFLRLADLAMPTVSLGQALGRLGCFSAGCCWGDVTTHARAPFAVEFPGASVARDLLGRLSGTPSLAWASQADRLHEARWVVEATGEVSAQPLPGGELIADWVSRHGHTLPVHPTQLYESLGQTVLFVALLWARRYRRFHGHIFALWLICYAFLRSTVETFRGDVERGTLHGLLASRFPGLVDLVPAKAWYNLSISQFISLGMLTLGAWLLVSNLRSVARQPKVDLAALTGVLPAP